MDHSSPATILDALHCLEQLRLPGTFLHEIQVGILTEKLSARLGLSPEECAAYRFAAELHDIGKLVLPDEVLHKNGRLTAAEYAVIQRHSALGHKILAAFDSPHLRLAADVAMAHHERWDGSGYPAGMRAEEIPLCARIVALCDVYSALREPRSYKTSLSHEAAIDGILNGKTLRNGLHTDQFDPSLIRIMRDDPDMFDVDFRGLHTKAAESGARPAWDAPPS